MSEPADGLRRRLCIAESSGVVPAVLTPRPWTEDLESSEPLKLLRLVETEDWRRKSRSITLSVGDCASSIAPKKEKLARGLLVGDAVGDGVLDLARRVALELPMQRLLKPEKSKECSVSSV